MSLTQLSIKAPAKLNLRLKVVGRRADGFHLLSMLNSTIDLFDEICLRKIVAPKRAERIKLIVLDTKQNLSALGADKSNLVYRAAELFFTSFNLVDSGVEIHLQKDIPIGAGLGGGSSDAAATLIGLSKLFKNQVSKSCDTDKLMDLGAKLGSDVAFFIKSKFCFVGGVGEKVFPIDSNPLTGKPVLLLMPQEHSCTAQIYHDFASLNPTAGLKPDLELENIIYSYPKILELIDNDLGAAVFIRKPICFSLFKQINSFDGVVGGLTGSGSALFCLPKIEADRAILAEVRKALPKEVPSIILNFC